MDKAMNKAKFWLKVHSAESKPISYKLPKSRESLESILLARLFLVIAYTIFKIYKKEFG
jgi:hypothetical protein